MAKKNQEDYCVEDFIADESFVNYFFHLKSPDELFWIDWISKNPGKIKVINEAKELINLLSISLSDNEYQTELRKMNRSLDKKRSKSIFTYLNWNKKHSRFTTKRNWIICFATILLIFLATAFFNHGYFKNNNAQLIKLSNISFKPISYTLSDSTIVTLDPNSSIQYSFIKENERNVYLKGNASFNVKRNLKAPFQVFDENIKTSVLGTIFKISKSGDTAIIVELFKGKLNVNSDYQNAKISKQIVLNSGESAIYIAGKKIFYKRKILPEINIFFHQNNFTEIAKRIKENFGITLINQSRKTNWRFTGEFKSNNDVRDIIETITQIESLTYTKKGDTIFIK